MNKKESVADIIKTIRSFENVMVANVSTITEKKEKDQRTEVNFTLDLIYMNLNAENEAVADEMATKEGKGE